MADIRAFRAFRYDMGRVGSLSDVVAPPYDVIDPPLQGRLFAASPYNAVRLELPQGGPGDTESENKYTRAARTLKGPPLVARDHHGITNRLWVVTDSHTISTVIGLMGPRPVFIADGHHRYETGLKYLDERKAAGEVPDDEAPANFCLMMLVGMSDPGLVILPTHRLVGGLPAVDTAQVEDAITDHFDVVGRFPDAAHVVAERPERPDVGHRRHPPG